MPDVIEYYEWFSRFESRKQPLRSNKSSDKLIFLESLVLMKVSYSYDEEEIKHESKSKYMLKQIDIIMISNFIVILIIHSPSFSYLQLQDVKSMSY